MFVGCGSGAPAEKAEEEAGGEETTVTQAPPRSEEEAAADEAKRKAAEQGKGGASNTISIDPNSPVPPDEQIEFFRLGCQAYKAEQAEGQEAVDAYFQEAISRGGTVAEVLSEQGYDCSNEEIRELQDEAKAEAKDQAERVQKESAEAQAKSGKNEAGQDVSGIPEMSSDERKAEGACLKTYYDSLPPDQRGLESQRVVREANAQGVTPGDVVGC